MKVFLVCTQLGGVLKVIKTDKTFEEVEKETIGRNFGEFLVEIDRETLEEFFDALNLVELECSECKGKFLIDTKYEGAVTCPYCGALVEDN